MYHFSEYFAIVEYSSIVVLGMTERHKAGLPPRKYLLMRQALLSESCIGPLPLFPTDKSIHVIQKEDCEIDRNRYILRALQRCQNPENDQHQIVGCVSERIIRGAQHGQHRGQKARRDRYGTEHEIGRIQRPQYIIKHGCRYGSPEQESPNVPGTQFLDRYFFSVFGRMPDPRDGRPHASCPGT